MVLADKAYSTRAIREHLRKRGIRAAIPVPADQRRGIAARYEKTATIYLAGFHIAGIFLWSAR
ncbi:hypothetical protein OID54_34025 [Streptomyces sp. NBC_00690]|nr:hypothetical protein [Streptomyces sp. NBC_00690]